MVRRQAPQPLALPGSAAAATPGSGGSVSGLSSLPNSNHSTSSSALASPKSSSTALGRERRSPQVAPPPPAPAADNTLQIISPVTSNKSAKSSPRSPFSRFNPARKLHQQTQSQSQATSPTLSQHSDALTPPALSQSTFADPEPPLLLSDSVYTDPWRQKQQEQRQAKQKQEVPPPAGPPPPPPLQSTRQQSQDEVLTQRRYQPRQELDHRPKTAGGTTQPSHQAAEQGRSNHRMLNSSNNSSSRSSPKPGNHLYQSRSRPSSPDKGAEVMSRGVECPAMPDKEQSRKYHKQTEIDQSSPDPQKQQAAPPLPSRSEVSLNSNEEHDRPDPRRNKPRPFGRLNRSRSAHSRERDGHRHKDSVTSKNSESERQLAAPPVEQAPLKTAPLQPEGQERSFRHMMNSAPRNHSADRAMAREMPPSRGQNRDRNERDQNRSQPSSYREPSGSFFSGLKHSGHRAVGMVSKQFFGKNSRSGSADATNVPTPGVDDEHYTLKVITLPLVEQTRLTRISKRLEDSRDKTEFWMPAFPWRAIDYLNFKGCEVEGLYRVPGSGPQIKRWQRRFDEEYDVDLFEQEELYDINIIGSMLKAWLRELPDEIFPKDIQERVSRECAGAEEVPQMLIDELSNLPPFNYYLLFAITCHLSLLHAHSEKNKMDFRNLCICFQPCLKIDAFCFKFLVCDWRECWQGCKTESQYIEEEYKRFEQPIPRGLAEPFKMNRDASQERNISSSDSGQPSEIAQQLQMQREQQPRGTGQTAKLRKKPQQSDPSTGSMTSNHSANHSASTSLTLDSERENPVKPPGDMRPLSPIKPLSPLGF